MPIKKHTCRLCGRDLNGSHKNKIYCDSCKPISLKLNNLRSYLKKNLCPNMKDTVDFAFSYLVYNNDSKSNPVMRKPRKR